MTSPSRTYKTVQTDDPHDAENNTEKLAYDFDRGSTTKEFAFAGLLLSFLVALICVILGALGLNRGTSNGITTGAYFIRLQHPSAVAEVLSLTLNVVVTICTEVVGIVHLASLRAALIRENRWQFNTNLRLFTSARTHNFFNFNSGIVNALLALTLIWSYSASSLIFTPGFEEFDVNDTSQILEGIYVSGMPLLILGVSLLVQASCASLSIISAQIMTWSSSPFDSTLACLHHGIIIYEPKRGMQSVVDSKKLASPQRPASIQPSAWKANTNVRRIVYVLWSTVAACFILGIVSVTSVCRGNKCSPSFIPGDDASAWDIGLDMEHNGNPVWMVAFLFLLPIQGPLTLGLHCTELIVNIKRDEARWRTATSKLGLKLNQNPVMAILSHTPTVILLLCKPILHRVFGLAFTANSHPSNTLFDIVLHPVQILYLAGIAAIFAAWATSLALLRPKGPQPAAYGHIQTLANLIDEWSPHMWWGDKGNGHAGTSEHPLPRVSEEEEYS